MALPIVYNHRVNETKIIVDPEEVIESLAELAGFTAYKVLDENSTFIGYCLEANDEDLREFIGTPMTQADIDEEKFIENGEAHYEKYAFIGDDF